VTPHNQIDFYYDFASPYAYLGSTQVERVAAPRGAIVRWRPILLGAVFKHIGTPMVPIFAMNEPKRRYQARDLQHWADYWGVAFRWPSRFPMNTVTALRIVHAVDDAARPRLSHALYRAYWVEDQDLADRAVLADVLEKEGLPPETLARAADPDIKDALRRATDEAIAAGLCGVPSFVVGGHLFWGQDRLQLVERVLAGWDPPA
jgi:2-hydroxychromene-2-carboxylate isomerase